MLYQTQKNLTILLIEDNANDRELSRLALLKQSNQEVIVLEADNAHEGLSLYRSKRPDCILLDYRLPALDGFWFLRKFTEEYGEIETAIIVITGQGNESVAVEAMKLGAQDYLVKGSITTGHLFRTVTNAIEKVTLKRTIENQRNTLQRSKQELEQFAYAALHDLQAPLRNVAALGERLKVEYNERIKPLGCRHIDRMQEEIAKMQKLTYKLSTLSRLESSSKRFISVDLSDIAKTVVANLEGHIAQVDGTVEINSLPKIEADAGQMYQLFQNLLAFELTLHSKKDPMVLEIDGIILENSDSRVSKAPLSGKICQVSVKDKSAGSDKQYDDHLFASLNPINSNEVYDGTGIGLAICRRIAERHHGKISAERVQGKGLNFTIQLPVKHPKPENKTSD